MKILVFIFLFFTNFFAYSGPINVGVLQFAPPFSSMAGDNHYYGFAIDIMDAICKRINEECSYKATSIQKQLELLDQGVTDISFTPTPISDDQLVNYVISLPYLVSNARFLTLKQGNIHTLANLKNHNIGVIKNTLYTALTHSPYVTPSKIKPFTKLTDLLAALASKDVDAIFINDILAKYLINNSGFDINTVGDKITIGKGYGIIALQKNADLIKKINNALLEMENDGSYLKIYNKYF